METKTHWTVLPRGYVKVNVHGTFTQVPLANGNNSGIGVVIRDRRGMIKAMVSGTIKGLDERSNHLYAMLVGLRRAFLDKKYKIILETDNQEAINEWKKSKKVMHKKRSHVLGKLKEIKEDLLKLDVACVPKDSNRLAIYLAKNGAETRRNLVNIDVPFGRVHELWCYDMGLEPEQKFLEVAEKDENMEEDGKVIQEMETETHWTVLPRGYVKVNVHGTFSTVPLANGNNSGIGVVIRDRRGMIKAMVSGTIEGLDERSNHLYAMLVGLRRAFLDKKYKIILETDNQEAINEWKKSKKVMHKKRSHVLGKLKEIKEDLLELDVACVPKDSNRLAIYLAENGAETRRNLVNIDVPFGRVHELWCYDMGLEPEQKFLEVAEKDENMEDDGKVIQEMETETHWTVLPRGYVKVNVHGTFSPVPLANGNNSGIGVVIRDRRGMIKAMVSGTIEGLDERSNHLYAMLVGLRRAFLNKKYKIILETDNQEAINEWKKSKKVMHKKRSHVLGKLKEIKEDLLELDVACVPKDSNRLAIYLAKNGAETRRNLVNIDVPFGRVHELWCYDMGLEPEQKFLEVADKNMEEDGKVIQDMPMEEKVVD